MHIVISKILEMLIPIDPRTDTTRFKNLFASGSRGRFAPWAKNLRKDPRPPQPLFFFNVNCYFFASFTRLCFLIKKSIQQKGDMKIIKAKAKANKPQIINGHPGNGS